MGVQKKGNKGWETMIIAHYACVKIS
jgi:hypothetical protein